MRARKKEIGREPREGQHGLFFGFTKKRFQTPAYPLFGPTYDSSTDSTDGTHCRQRYRADCTDAEYKEVAFTWMYPIMHPACADVADAHTHACGAHACVLADALILFAPSWTPDCIVEKHRRTRAVGLQAARSPHFIVGSDGRQRCQLEHSASDTELRLRSTGTVLCVLAGCNVCCSGAAKGKVAKHRVAAAAMDSSACPTAPALVLPPRCAATCETLPPTAP